MALKLCLPGRFDRLAILLYLLIGWSGAMTYEAVFGALPGSTLGLLVAGGARYTVGVVFYVWESLRFHNAIWHAFVHVAAACHYGAVLDCMVLARGNCRRGVVAAALCNPGLLGRQDAPGPSIGVRRLFRRNEGRSVSRHLREHPNRGFPDAER